MLTTNPAIPKVRPIMSPAPRISPNPMIEIGNPKRGATMTNGAPANGMY